MSCANTIINKSAEAFSLVPGAALLYPQDRDCKRCCQWVFLPFFNGFFTVVNVKI
jgi:hypothetical protein